jgi:peptidoglycan/LPS O-acetylase OafA/YrhL
MVSHFIIAGQFPEPLLLSHRLVTAIARNGYLGVTIFFVISGFVITQTSIRRYKSLKNFKIINFYCLRISRILPPLLLIVVINLFLFYLNYPGFEIPKDTHITIKQILFAVFTFRFNNLYLLGASALLAWCPLWSLSIEEVFYILFPILAKTTKHRETLIGILLFLWINGIHHRIVNGFHGLNEYMGCFDAIALGCATAIVSQYTWFKSFREDFSHIMRYAGILIIALSLLAFDIHTQNYHIWLPSVISLAAAIFLLGSQVDIHTPSLDLVGKAYGLVGVCGFLSYEIYIFHLPLFMLLKSILFKIYLYLDRNMPVDLAFVSVLLVIVGICKSISYFYSEPLLKVIRSKIKA